jgi:hypothetical protein
MRIEDYEFGRIHVGGKSYSADLIVYPDRVEPDWWRKRGHYLQVEDLSGRIGTRCDALIIGTGAHGAMKVSEEVEDWLKERGIPWESHPTGSACDRYNALLDEGKQVVAALHLTC